MPAVLNLLNNLARLGMCTSQWTDYRWQSKTIWQDQFGRKVNKNDLLLLVLNQQFCYVTKAIEKAAVIVQLIGVRILI